MDPGAIFSFPIGVTAENMSMSFTQAEFWGIIGICVWGKLRTKKFWRKQARKEWVQHPLAGLVPW